VSVYISNTSKETTCLKLTLTKFAGSIKKVLVRCTGMNHHKKSIAYKYCYSHKDDDMMIMMTDEW